MARLRHLTVTTLLIAASMFASPAGAQTANTFKARLSPVPVDANTQARTTGMGSVSATLKGTTLSVTGTFSGLQGPATIAQVHVGPRGIRGPAVLDLTVTNATAGTIQGDLTLTAAQVDHLRRNRLYVQIHSEAAPDGNLWGWLIQ
jgi:hypothetical protein